MRTFSELICFSHFLRIDTAAANNLANNASGTTSVSSIPSTPAKRMNPVVVLEECTLDDYAPLFYSPGKCGYYSPREGFAGFERLNAFRNVGRYVIKTNIYEYGNSRIDRYSIDSFAFYLI